MLLRLIMLSSSRSISSFNDSKIGSRIEARIDLFAAGGPFVARWSHGVVLDASSSESVEDDRSKTSLWVVAVAVAILSESHFAVSELRGTSALASLKWLGEPIICHMVLQFYLNSETNVGEGGISFYSCKL